MSHRQREARAPGLTEVEYHRLKERAPTTATALWAAAYDPSSKGNDRDSCGFAPLLPPSNIPRSSATLPTCTDRCEICFASFRSEDVQRLPGNQYRVAVADGEAKSKLIDMVESTTTKLQHVRDSLEEYGDAILSRWTRRTRGKRCDLLLQAMPAIYKSRFAAMGLMRDRLQVMSQAGRPGLDLGAAAQTIFGQRASFLHDWLDMPTLCEDPSYLLSLLHNRAYSSPSEWARFDSEQIKTHLQHMVYDTDFNPHCVVIEGADFGSLVQWSRDAAHRGEIVGYPLGELIIEGQLILADFLYTVVNLSLQKTDAQTPRSCVKWTNLSSTDFKKPNKTTLILQSDYSDAPYSKPPAFDANRLVEMIDCRFSAAEEDLWQMQVDPSAVRDMLDSIRATAHYAALSPAEGRSQTMRIMLAPLRPQGHWKFMLVVSQRLQEMHKYHNNDIQLGRNLPKDYETLLSLLESLLRSHFDAQLVHLRFLTSFVPDFQRHYKFTSFEERQKDPSKGFSRPASSPDHFWEEEKLFFALMQLRKHDDRQQHGTPQLWFHMIDHFTNLPPKKGNPRIPDFLRRHLSDMITCHEALTMIWNHKPARRARRDHTGPETLAVVGSPESALDWTFGRVVLEELQDLWEHLSLPIEKFLLLPSPTAKGCKDPVARLQAYYAGLAEFWKASGDVLLSCRDSQPDRWTTLPKDFLDHVSAYETTEYEMEMETDCMMLRQNVEAEDKLANMSMIERLSLGNPSTLAANTTDTKAQAQSQWGDEAVPNLAIKNKQKTKGRPNPPGADNNGDRVLLVAEDVPTEEEQSVILVDEISSKELFDTMFGTSKTAVGMTKWEAFLAAFLDAGFSATCTGGSAVSLRDNRKGTGAISFHKRHPDPTMNYKMLKSHARRLRRQFGWSKETFVYREKDL